jgi:hypothetical protein
LLIPQKFVIPQAGTRNPPGCEKERVPVAAGMTGKIIFSVFMKPSNLKVRHLHPSNSIAA